MKFFITPLDPLGPLRSKKFQTTLILAFEANSALSRENETKIVKITDSEKGRKKYVYKLYFRIWSDGLPDYKYIFKFLHTPVFDL